MRVYPNPNAYHAVAPERSSLHELAALAWHWSGPAAVRLNVPPFDMFLPPGFTYAQLPGTTTQAGRRLSILVEVARASSAVFGGSRVTSVLPRLPFSPEESEQGLLTSTSTSATAIRARVLSSIQLLPGRASSWDGRLGIFILDGKLAKTAKFGFWWGAMRTGW